MNGRVIKSTGSWYQVMPDSGEIYSCRLKGRFRMGDSKLTNPIAVGDEVEFELEEKEAGQGMIRKIMDRKNYLIRKSNKLSSQYQIIASNIDTILLVATIAKPRTTTVFIDRVLLAAESYGIPVILIFNKTDIYNETMKRFLNEYQSMYEQIGYRVISMSVFNKGDLERLRPLIDHKVSLITGHSGVGKSTLMNQLNPRLNIKTGALSKYHERGMHSTTFAEMHSISEDTYIIDTPGIKDFGLVEFDQDNISMYFPDIRQYAVQCKFNNCTHYDEPGCRVLDALHEGRIHLSRYESYLNIFMSIQTK